MGQEKYEVWFAGIRGLGARKKYLLHEALKSCRNAYYIEETQLKKFPFLTEKDCQEIRQAQKRKDPEKICEEMKKKGIEFETEEDLHESEAEPKVDPRLAVLSKLLNDTQDN